MHRDHSERKHSMALDLPLRPSATPVALHPSSPPTLIATCPSTLSISAKSAESRDDFPQPTWPTTATKEPSGMEKVMLKRHNTAPQSCSHLDEARPRSWMYPERRERQKAGLSRASELWKSLSRVPAELSSVISLRGLPRVRPRPDAEMPAIWENGDSGRDLSDQTDARGTTQVPWGRGHLKTNWEGRVRARHRNLEQLKKRLGL